jgi:long-chain acyl-CoA synthetase
MYPGTFAARFPDKPAVIVAGSGETLTYADLDDRSIRLARYLGERGLAPGDHIALLTDNTPRAFEVYWAALRSGLYITTINRHLTPSEAAYIVNDCGARALVASAGVGGLAASVARDSTAVQVLLAGGGDVDGYESYEEALRGVSGDPLPSQPRGTDMLYSSGTTGRPRGIKPPLPIGQVDEPGDLNSAVLVPLFGLDGDTVYLSPAPVYHAAPLRFGATVQSTGGTVVLMDHFEAADALAAIEKYRVSHSQWVPTMFVRMLKLHDEIRGGFDLSSHRVGVHAAAPCPIEVKRAMIDWWGPILHEYYSSTEANGFTAIDSEQWLRKPGSVGRALLGVVHVCGDDGSELPAGEVGGIYFERDELPFGYHNDPEKTAAAQHSHHPSWTTTGDIGYCDGDGFLYLTGRKAFTIISGGVNIYPQEIEDALALHPKVFDVAVIGVPDAEMGESVAAVVQPIGSDVDRDVLAEELTEYLRERIARYKVPRSFRFVDELPRTPVGKVVKHQLLAQTPVTPAPSVSR